MLIINVLLLFSIIKTFIRDKYFSILGTLIYTLSPLTIYYGTRILLDNIMVLFTLFSSFIYIKIKNKKLGLLLSGILMGIAILIKENTVFYVLPMLGIIFWNDKDEIYKAIKSSLIWTLSLGLAVINYPLLAYYRGELFPTDYFEGEEYPSLISTIIFQSQRGKSEVFSFDENPFWETISFWTKEDPVLVIGGIIFTLCNLFIGVTSKSFTLLMLFLFVMIQFLFFMRGGIVFPFYILPVLPFLAINLAYSLSIINFLQNKYMKISVMLILLAFSMYSILSVQGGNPFTSKQTEAQIQSINWINENNHSEIVIVGDSYLKGEFYNKPGYTVYSHFDAEFDQTLVDCYKTVEQKIDLFVSTTQVELDAEKLPFIKSLPSSFIVIKNFESENWDVQISAPLQNLVK